MVLLMCAPQQCLFLTVAPSFHHPRWSGTPFSVLPLLRLFCSVSDRSLFKNPLICSLYQSFPPKGAASLNISHSTAGHNLGHDAF